MRSSGTHTLTKYDGNTLTMNILSPIVKSMSCDYISEGVLQVQGGLLNGDINYGEGECDNTAVYTHHNGLTFNMNL